MLIKLSSGKYIPHDRIELISPKKEGYDLFASEDLRIDITQEDLDRIIKACGLSSKEQDEKVSTSMPITSVRNMQIVEIPK